MLSVKVLFRGLSAPVLLLSAGILLAACGESSQPLPEEKAETVVEKFYEYISEAKIRGGNLLIREAYKLTSAKKSRLSQPKFVEIVNKYPTGFKVKVVDGKITDRHADVTIEYMMASMFGKAYAVRTVIPLNVDEESNTWKIDFTGETDGQNLATMQSTETVAESKQTASGEK